MNSKPTFVLGKANYKLMLIALGIMIVGYLLMAGRANNNNIFSFVRITLSPFLIMCGYVIMIVAIMIKSKQ